MSGGLDDEPFEYRATKDGRVRIVFRGRVVTTLVKKGYVEQGADAQDGRAIALSATRKGRNLCARISNDLVGQQKQLLQDLDPEVRAGVVQVLRRLAQAADARFRSGAAGGDAKTCCAPSSDACRCE